MSTVLRTITFLAAMAITMAFMGFSGSLQAEGTPAKRMLSKDEEAIVAIIRESEQGYVERNPEKVLVMYNNNQLMFFDLMPPMKDCCGVERGREKLVQFMSGTTGPVVMEFRELEVTADHNLGYTTSLLHFAFTSKDGKKSAIDGRCTQAWKRIDGKWSAVHEHCSVPATVADWMTPS